MRFAKLPAPCVLLLLPLLAGGCGGPKIAPPSKQEQEMGEFTSVLRMLSDSAQDPARAPEIFSGTPGKDSARYGAFVYDMVAPPKIDGDTATVRIQMRPKATKEAEWIFVRDGGKWKIKAAPLP